MRYDVHHAQLADSELLTQLRTKFTVVSIYPEMLGRLLTLRAPADTVNQQGRIEVVDCDGQLVTDAFVEGARQACVIAKKYQITRALLKSKSPSCGRGLIYDGSFTGNLQEGNGITVQHLQNTSVQVYHEGEVMLLLDEN
ncbi:DUF523 domain-containing protein [Psychrobacter frigidicola]|uniref:DUF523 domain-containing protein n=1 Tax=Psychrobacter frigidicola TaxID=45611 RepID=A0A5C7A0S7_9GAMM|nr:DUF523 domain-containing protein [Psychrobacter frigidicola]TXD96030.1 DUF523 domain-containing protein [Psychrobacter frigidicola]